MFHDFLFGKPLPGREKNINIFINTGIYNIVVKISITITNTTETLHANATYDFGGRSICTDSIQTCK